MCEEGVGYGELQLVSPYEVQTIHDLKLIQTVNEHARLFLTGIIPEDKKASCIALASSADQIELNQVKDGQLVRPLFKGLVTEIAIRMVRDIYYVEIEAISHTFHLDIQRASRSFQNKRMTYTELIEQVLATYPGSDSIDSASRSTQLGNFVLQYKETDWQFLKRMASHFGTVLVAEAVADAPKVWFGVPEGQVGELPAHTYTLAKDLSTYRNTAHNDTARPLVENEVLTYGIQSKQRLHLGDRVHLKGEELVVATAIVRMKQGILTYDYLLTAEAGIRQARMYAPTLTGTSVEGTVLDVTKEGVRLHLAIDAEQKKEEATWFPLAPLYTAEGHSGLYCPPELGDTVHLTFLNRREEEAVVRHSLRKEGATNPKTADPGITYWGTPYGKEMKLDRQEVSVTAKEGTLFLKLHEEDGIELHSQQPLVLKAEQDLHFTGKQRLIMTAEESIHFTCDASSLVLDGSTDIQGELVEMDGSTKAPVSVSSVEEEDEIDELQLGLDVAGMMPLAGGADG
ncbi:contractile injection system protein, VgrG/Pvc8 family [Sporosarcina limicola]|nr:contractile injection system protein, VgrG/Pvc8 family [Sporosarcina limicola]